MPNDIKRVPLVSLRLVRERNVPYPASLTGPAAAAELARNLLEDLDREAFLVIHLSAKNVPLSVELSAVGTLSATLVHPREVFKAAILANAAALIVAHNHPSGDPTPSPEDLTLTRTLLDASSVLGIRLLDHLVIGAGRWVSLRDQRPDLGDWG